MKTSISFSRKMAAGLSILLALSNNSALLTVRAETDESGQQEDTAEILNEEIVQEEVTETGDTSEDETAQEKVTEISEASEEVTVQEEMSGSDSASENKTLESEEGEETDQPEVIQGEDTDYEISVSGEAQMPENDTETNDISAEETPELAEAPAYPAFFRQVTENGIEISVSAEEGVFPAGADLTVAVVTGENQSQAEEAVEQKRTADGEVAASYTFDIKVVDKDGNEIQPADGKMVSVSFKTAEVANENLETSIYHLEDKNGELDAVKLDVNEEGTTARVDTDGFSLYTVEFTYQTKTYVLSGGEEISLSTILEAVLLSGEAEAVEVSNQDLFSVAKNENNEWIVTSHQAFDTEEWMKVTIGGIEYTIIVTDDSEELTIAVGETKSILLNEEKKVSLTCTPEETGLYRFSVDEEYMDNIVVSDYTNKKPFAQSEGTPEILFSMEAGKTYQIDVVGNTTKEATAKLEKHEVFEGTESFRITKINGQDVPENYGVYIPAEAGCTYELKAEIPLWHLVSSEDAVTDIEIESESGEPSVFNEDDTVQVLLGENSFSDVTHTFYGGSWDSNHNFEFSEEQLREAFAEDPNQIITIIISGKTPETYSYLSEIEGLDGYPAWYEDRYLENESEMMASGFNFTLHYHPLPHQNCVYHTVAIVPDKLTLAVILGNTSADSFEVDEEGIWWKYLPDGMTQDEPATLSLTGSGISVPAVYGGYTEEDYLLEGFMEVSRLYDDEHRVVAFIGIPAGTYTLSFHDPVGDTTIEKQLTVEQGPQYVTDLNEAGFRLVYDGIEVPWNNYGRLLASVESGDSSSQIPAYPFGCLNGAAVSLNIEAPAAETVMKIVRDDGTLVDADTAAYGETVTFRTTAHSPAQDSPAGHTFEFTFPDSLFRDNFSGSSERIKPFEVDGDSISIKATTASGEEITLTNNDSGDPNTYYIETDEYISNYDDDAGYLKFYIDMSLEPVQEDVTITIDIPAKLTGALSCGGYGNRVEMTHNGPQNREFIDVNVVYTGTFILQKIDKQANPLAGAVFKLEKVDDPDFTPASVAGLSMHFVPHSVIYGDDDNSLVLVGHEGVVVSAEDGQEVDDQTGALSFAGVKEGTYLLLETKAPQGHRALEIPLVIELSANLPETIVTGNEYCRWSVKLNGKALPELVRYQVGLIDPELPTEAFMDSFIAYSCQSSTIVLRVINVPNNITAEVVWEDEGQEDKRPESVDIQLKQNGTGYGDAVTANADNSWSYTWESLSSAEDDWTVEQIAFANADEYETTYEPIQFEEEKAILKVINKIKPFEYTYTDTTPLWVKDSGVPADFTVKRSINDHYTFPRFTEILVDGTKVDSSNYTAKAGSVELTLNADYLQTLDVGTHTLTTNFTDGTVDTEFEVVDKETVIHTVTFDSAGGTEVAKQQVEDGKTATEPTAPTKEGYTFDGWYLNGMKYNFSTPVTKDIVLKAKWTAVTPVKPTAKPEEPKKPANNTGRRTVVPNTGDGSNMYFWLLMLIISAAGGLGSMLVLKTKTR